MTKPTHGPKLTKAKTRFGKALVKWRTERNLSRIETAAAIGVTEFTVATWECRKNVPKTPIVVRQLQLLGVIPKDAKPDGTLLESATS